MYFHVYIYIHINWLINWFTLIDIIYKYFKMHKLNIFILNIYCMCVYLYIDNKYTQYTHTYIM